MDGPALLHTMNKLMISCDKILIAAVNGPGVGYGTTSLGLFDLVYSVPESYFFTPFVKWGLAAEACSSFTFARALGRQKASHLLLTGERMTAQDLESAGLISKIFPADDFLNKVLGIAHNVAELPPISLKANKSLVTSYFKDQLHRANDLELELFAKLAAGSETKEAVQKFAVEQRAKKLRLAKRENL
ncbi:dodecenoyl delta-isomerase [Fusarium globosum]|uniref:Dodecenoyl delta-isomerase n=1 Tax=Fusarium globosum TaxID=78864 RepID=A0A8H5YDT7_9HYPO|nr:dodecenoyl delta-isomerase [Fusarium globosum]